MKESTCCIICRAVLFCVAGLAIWGLAFVGMAYLALT